MSPNGGAICLAAASLLVIAVSWLLNMAISENAVAQVQGNLSIAGGGQYAAVLVILISMLSVLVPLMSGYLLGRRRAIGAYMTYVLNKVPLGEREAIASLAHDEAVRAEVMRARTRGHHQRSTEG